MHTEDDFAPSSTLLSSGVGGRSRMCLRSPDIWKNVNEYHYFKVLKALCLFFIPKQTYQPLMAVLVVYLARLAPLVEQVDKLVRQTQHLGVLWIYYYIIIIIVLLFYIIIISRRTVFVNILICHWWKWRWIRDRICSFSFAKFSHKRLFCWEKNYTLNTRSILSVWYILFSGLVHGSKSKYLRNKLTKLDPTILEQTSQEFVYILTVSQSIECIK